MNLYQSDVEKFTPDNLINEAYPTVEKYVKIKKSSNPVLRGTVLGVNTTSGYAVAVDSSKSDGTEKPLYVLAYDVDPSAGDVEAVAYSTGMFNRQALIFGGSDTAETHENELRKLGIHIKDNI